MPERCSPLSSMNNKEIQTVVNNEPFFKDGKLKMRNLNVLSALEQCECDPDW